MAVENQLPYKMPASMRCGIWTYVISDSTGGTLVAEAMGATLFNPDHFDAFLQAAIITANKAFGAKDARGMTEEEVSLHIASRYGKDAED